MLDFSMPAVTNTAYLEIMGLRVLSEWAQDMVRRGAIFFISHSGGKDSQAMYAILRHLIPAQQIVVMHSDLGEVEWKGTKDHIMATIDHELHVTKAGKTFLQMVLTRHESRPEVPSWPSSATRQCTSDLKRGPLERLMRHIMAERDCKLAVNCMGLRAEESASRAKKAEIKLNPNMSKAGRQVYDWLPIHDLTTDEVFALIAAAGQAPHYAYLSTEDGLPGNKRLSCMFCIMGSPSDLAHAADENPELYETYLEVEKLTGWTMFSGASLADKVEKGRADRALLLPAPAHLQLEAEIEISPLATPKATFSFDCGCDTGVPCEEHALFPIKPAAEKPEKPVQLTLF